MVCSTHSLIFWDFCSADSLMKAQKKFLPDYIHEFWRTLTAIDSLNSLTNSFIECL